MPSASEATTTAVGRRLAELEGVIKEMPPSVPVDYHHECVPKGLLKYALVDRGHKSGACRVMLCQRSPPLLLPPPPPPPSTHNHDRQACCRWR